MLSTDVPVLEPPMYALLVAPDEMMRENIVSGKKKITIREGNINYWPGTTVMLCCHLEPWAVMADITGVRCCKLSKVTPEEYRADGFQTQEELLQGLQKYYPNITLDSPVTVIRWDNVQGKLVDDYKYVTDFEHVVLEKVCPNQRLGFLNLVVDDFDDFGCRWTEDAEKFDQHQRECNSCAKIFSDYQYFTAKYLYELRDPMIDKLRNRVESLYKDMKPIYEEIKEVHKNEIVEPRQSFLQKVWNILCDMLR